MIWNIVGAGCGFLLLGFQVGKVTEQRKQQLISRALEATIKQLSQQLSDLADYAAALEKLKSPESEKSGLPSGSASASVPSDRVARGYPLPPGLQPPK